MALFKYVGSKRKKKFVQLSIASVIFPEGITVWKGGGVTCRPVNFKKVNCRPVDLKKVTCCPVDFKKVSCRMSHVA